MKQNFLALRSRSCANAENTSQHPLNSFKRRKEGEQATHPIGVGPVEEEGEHLVSEQAEDARRDPVVRDAHEWDEVEDACGPSSASISASLPTEEEKRREQCRDAPNHLLQVFHFMLLIAENGKPVVSGPA